MKIIFLDFDGVIRIPVFTGGPEVEAEFCAERMKRVARLAEETGARIVISSDWRQRYDRAGMTDLLEPQIPRGLLHADWMTPALMSVPTAPKDESAIPRGAEILSWLARNLGVKHFAVLDDMHSKRFPLMKENLVTCQLLDGFTEERFAKAIQVLSS